MIRAVLFADPHLGIHKSSDIWHNAYINLAKEMVDVCVKKNMDTIICLGDWFDSRKYLDIRTMNVASQIADIFKDLKVYIIAGNHDTFYKDRIEPTSLTFFQKHKNIAIILEPFILDNLVLIPWNKHAFLFTPEAEKYKDNIILGHFEINGFAVTEDYIFRDAALNAEDFQKFRSVLTGHFHAPSRRGNIIYLGSPFQLTFNDSGSRRGYYILDEQKLSFREFTGAPKFVRITTEEKPTKELVEGNIVKLIYLKDYGNIENNKKLEWVQRLQPLFLSTDFSKSLEISKKYNTDATEIKDNKDILFDFIENVAAPPNIKPYMLKDIVNMLLRSKNEQE
jgi:DNA repair exonuclease SbcCD nuclease subunit